MIINTRDYADFKKVVAAMRYVDGVFYNIRGDGSADAAGFFLWAFCREDGIGVQMQIHDSLALTDAIVLADFPSAQILNHAINFSTSSVFV